MRWKSHVRCEVGENKEGYIIIYFLTNYKYLLNNYNLWNYYLSLLNIYPSKIKILSTKDTKPVKLPDKYLENYPVIYPDYPVDDEVFVDSVRISNLYTGALGADYHFHSCHFKQPCELLENP